MRNGDWPLVAASRKPYFPIKFTPGSEQGIMRESAVKTETEQVSAAELGWRFGIGTALIAGGYIAWTLIPVVIATDLEPALKAALTGLFGATPFLTKLLAVVIMGRPAYTFLKKTIHNFIRRRTGRSEQA